MDSTARRRRGRAEPVGPALPGAPAPWTLSPARRDSDRVAAVLLDAFLVRLVLLPVLLRLTGRAAWWVPGWLRRILPDIHFSHG